jgi:hypothetical protein
MKIDIKNKLKNYFEYRDLKESDVVYILVQIGKIIEYEHVHETYDTLWFYRNWVSHPKIDSQTAFVKELRDKVKNIHLSDDLITLKLLGFISFIELKNEIIRFFHKEIEKDKLPSKVFLESFKKSLIQVIADIPVTIILEDKNTIRIAFDQSGEFKIRGPGDYSGSVRILE